VTSDITNAAPEIMVVSNVIIIANDCTANFDALSSERRGNGRKICGYIYISPSIVLATMGTKKML